MYTTDTSGGAEPLTTNFPSTLTSPNVTIYRKWLKKERKKRQKTTRVPFASYKSIINEAKVPEEPRGGLNVSSWGHTAWGRFKTTSDLSEQHYSVSCPNKKSTAIKHAPEAKVVQEVEENRFLQAGGTDLFDRIALKAASHWFPHGFWRRTNRDVQVRLLSAHFPLQSSSSRD